MYIHVHVHIYIHIYIHVYEIGTRPARTVGAAGRGPMREKKHFVQRSEEHTSELQSR